MMFTFCVKTGILFIILCTGISGLPYKGKKIQNEKLELYKEPGGSEVDRIKRSPHYPEEFGSREFDHDGPPHGLVGYGHPGWGRWSHGPHPVFGGFGNHHYHGPPDANFPYEHSPEWHKKHPHFGPPDHGHFDPYHKNQFPKQPVDQEPLYGHHNDHGPYGHHNKDQEPYEHHNNKDHHPSEDTPPFSPKTNTQNFPGVGDFSDIKPVSEPNLDVDNRQPQSNGVITENSSTEYPNIDIRAGV